MDDRLQFLLDELRHARASRGMTQEDLARAMNYSPSTIGMVETGGRRPPPGFWELLDKVLKTGGLFVRLLKRLGSPQWMQEWEGAEREALVLRSYQSMVVPGLLQTEAYARSMFQAGNMLTDEEINNRVTNRLDRQSVFTREKPPQFTAVLDEAVLRRPIGSPRVMREQLLHLVKATERPRLRLHIVPSSVGAYLGLGGPFVLATLPSGEDVAYLDNQLKGQVIDRAEDVTLVREAWESIHGEALPHQQSVELILGVAETWI
ncbi:helix-turn-helix domain-containing protein [Micromonospora sp. NBC_01796]|uniref:helix-turn-helix domain-containing protein n=1 Tax=Micromonospora sp. NBC_01796 TaxID=2975987 RepID=UPI002DDBAB84|nr:helix-turn-helix transcriptional regulator [Micromonospora sp. NBC_01796]WSA86406.1 helix-turn-helix transcriptional regulator [Micromonospora sp. NBC_01796]